MQTEGQANPWGKMGIKTMRRAARGSDKSIGSWALSRDSTCFRGQFKLFCPTKQVILVGKTTCFPQWGFLPRAASGVNPGNLRSRRHWLIEWDKKRSTAGIVRQ